MTKFAYLKELVEQKVRADIDGLPFTNDGYERAKDIQKSQYGKTSEIVNAYVNNIIELPMLTGTNPRKVDSFYKTLLYNVQSLETLGKLGSVGGKAGKRRGECQSGVGETERDQSRPSTRKVRMARLGLLATSPSLKEWRDINPIKRVESLKTGRFNWRQEGSSPPCVRSYLTRQSAHGCVYCESPDHKTSNCPKCVIVDERKQVLVSKRKSDQDISNVVNNITLLYVATPLLKNSCLWFNPRTAVR